MKFSNLSLFAVAVTLFLSGVFISTETLADHGPERMWQRQIKPYFKAHETGMVGPFKVNMESFGRELPSTVKQIKKQNFDEFFDDEYNLAAIVRKNNKVVYARFDDNRKINSQTPIQGMSMSKTALGAAVGSLVCDGSIKSLDDEIGTYAVGLRETAYNKISIRNVLQMNSGVTPLGRRDVRLANQMAMGMKKFAGNADVLAAVHHFKGTSRKQGEQHNYHSADPFALSVLVFELTGKSVAQIFYETVFKRFGPNGQMHWVADNKGRTVSQARLVMTAPDWNSFGQFIIDEVKSESCMGRFFKEGISSSVSTHRENVRYGFQFWVYDVDGESAITMTGHGGFFNILSVEKNTVISIFSVDEEYEAGNLFSNGVLAKIASEIVR
ncbi:MAG: serine hydrolase [Pseudomonadota bacterium]|nr:serine hydrolase [Pseudomonadota bacterium]